MDAVIRNTIFTFFMLFTVVNRSPACGPWFPESIAGNESRILRLEKRDFFEEVRDLLQLKPTERDWSRSPWKNTLDADVADLASALGGNPDSLLLDQYRAMRMRMQLATDGTEYGVSFQQRGDRADRRSYAWTAADLELLKRVPAEFVLYLEGAAEYRSQNFTAAIDKFEKILALPETERRHRSVWAAFMIGKSWLFSDPARSIPYFEQTRQLAANDFPDRLNLSAVSFGWQAFAERKLGRLADSLRSYINQAGNMAPDDLLFASMRTVCGDMVRAGKIEPGVVADPVSRKILAFYATTRHPSNSRSPVAYGKIVGEAFTAAGVTVEPEIADRFAHSAYASGNFDEARRWLGLSSTRTLVGHWVEAKLLLYDGRIDEGLAVLRSVIREFPAIPPADDTAGQPSVYAGVQRDRAVLLLGRADFIEAFDAMIHAGSWEDVAYMAERVLTLREVSAYLRAHADESALKGVRDDVHYVLARRLARAHLWSQARNHYPEAMKAEFDFYRGFLRAGLDQTQPRRERAQNLFKAAWMMRYRGMELFGTELNPDWSVYRGNYDQGVFVERRKQTLKLDRNTPVFRAIRVTRTELDRADQHSVLFEKRWHYRFRASELMWQAAQLTPDNDPLTAAALYWGGNWHRNRVEEDAYADRFYQQLVRRCAKLPIGIEADKLRWFPHEPPPTPVELPIAAQRANTPQY